jgi:hypothetical protein
LIVLFLQIESDLKDKIQQIKVANPDSFCVRFEINKVILVGETEHVDRIYETIKDSIDSLENDIDNKGKEITKAVKLEGYQLEIFVEFNLHEQLKWVRSEPDVDQHVVLQVNMFLLCH